MNYQIEPLLNEDWLKVCSIYAESINTGVASFGNLQTVETGIPFDCHLVVLLLEKEKIFLVGLHGVLFPVLEDMFESLG